MRFFSNAVYFFLLAFLLTTTPAFARVGEKDIPFIQEYHQPFPLSENPVENRTRAIVVDQQDEVWAGSDFGLFLLDQTTGKWKQQLNAKEAGPIFDLTVDLDGAVWAAAWNGIYIADKSSVKKIEGITQPLSVIAATKNGIIAMGPDGVWKSTNNWRKEALPFSKQLRAILADPTESLWIATGLGLYHQRNNKITLFQNENFLITPDLTGIDFGPGGSLWVAGMGGISVLRNGLRIDKYRPRDGLPTIYLTCIKRAPDSTMWVGTTRGVTRFNGQSWSLRHSRRWLLNDHVNDLDFDSKGTAWIATDGGISSIHRKKMTLQQKAIYFQKVLQNRHVRSPYLVEKCRLTVPGDTSSWAPRDDDNDGQYTSMYLGMESYRYAATKDPGARENAGKAFEALKFLQTVTETPGFVARTVIPSSWATMADPNRNYTDREKAKIRLSNPREKFVEKRWRSSKDGKWLWKGDTSSDEITGHMFGYLLYFDLVADGHEKKMVADHICKIVDYIMKGGYTLRDIDGQPTKWGVWNPEKLNNDPDWVLEKNINSLEILSYLKLAYHVSGREKYQRAYHDLLFRQHYLQNIRRPKTTNPSWRTHIDDELLALAYPCLLLYEKDPTIRAALLEGFEQWFQETVKENSPFFNFTYGAFTRTNPNPDISLSFLRNTPLDLISWRIDNRQREDIHLTHLPEMEHTQTSRLLPIDEISFFRWDRNPWIAVQGNEGRTESDGVFWLLPYWMGRYYRFIGEE